VQATFDGGDQAQALRDAAEVYLRRHRVELSMA
jgi:1,2-phenylacetyl-CoA epoxidase PaaB subunit